MEAASIHEFINSLYPDPTFIEWKPSEYDLKYSFKPTPRGMKALAARKEKEDAKLKAVFDAKVEQKAKVHSIVDEIATYPSEISSLFFNTFKWKINYLNKCHEEFLALKSKLDGYGSLVDNNALYHIQSAMRHTTWDVSWSGRRTSRTSYVVLSSEDWDKLAASFRGKCIQMPNGKWEHEYPLKKVEDPNALMELVVAYTEALKRDELSVKGEDAYSDAIIHMANVLESIIEDLKKHFNGNKPTQCLTDASWGAKGEFCGVLTDGATKVSFKSFSAGGHTIQCFHFRFKATKLKH